jgi:flagellar motor component MotA
MSDPVAIGLAVIVMIVVITLGAIWKYPQVGSVLQLWAPFGTLTGAMATYFFTREQVQRQESQIKLYRAAFQASEKEKAEAGKQFLNLVEKIRPDVTSPQNKRLLEEYVRYATDLTQMRKFRVGKKPEPLFDLYKEFGSTPSPSP